LLAVVWDLSGLCLSGLCLSLLVYLFMATALGAFLASRPVWPLSPISELLTFVVTALTYV